MSLKTQQAKQNFQGNIVFIHWQQMPNPTSLSEASTVRPGPPYCPGTRLPSISNSKIANKLINTENFQGVEKKKANLGDRRSSEQTA